MVCSSTLLSLCVTGRGTTQGVAETVQILHQQQQPPPPPQNLRRSALTTALRQIMECMLRVAVRTLTASVLLEKVIFTTALLTQSLILSLDFVTLLTLLSAATAQQQPQASQEIQPWRLQQLPRCRQRQQQSLQAQQP